MTNEIVQARRNQNNFPYSKPNTSGPKKSIDKYIFNSMQLINKNFPNKRKQHEKTQKKIRKRSIPAIFFNWLRLN
jgi:hypothetical protein